MNGESILKSDRSPVTVADFASQAVLCKMVSERFPEDVIAAEENSEEIQIDHCGGSRGKGHQSPGRGTRFSTGFRMERNHGILASNGKLHEAVLRALKLKVK